MISKKLNHNYSSLGTIVTKIEGGGTPSKEVPNYWGGEIPLLTIKDLPTAKYGITVDSITNQGLESSSSKIVPAGIPIIGTRMDVGRVVRSPVPVAINQDLRALYPDIKKVDVNYLVQVLPSLEREFQRYSCGSTVMGIGIDDLKSIRIYLPPLDEQRKIAEILRTWDEAIETAEAELKAKQERKRWLMEKSFSSIFGNHTGNSVSLGSIVKLVKGKKPELYDTQSKGSKPYLVAKFIRGDEKPKYAFLNDKNAVSVTPSDIVIICDGSNSGEMFSGLDGVLSSTMAKLVVMSDEFEQAYVQFFVAYNGDKLTDAQEGGAIPHLDRDKLLKLRVFVRTHAEQLQIIECLRSNEDSIINVQQRLELLRTQKRGLMQKLLTGEIRVAA